jgi:hypothetical protein
VGRAEGESGNAINLLLSIGEQTATAINSNDPVSPSHTTLALTWTSTPESKLWQMVSCWRALVSVSCIGKWNKTNSLCSRRMFYWSWRSWSWSIQAHESCILQRAGLTQKHQVQNGLLLCANCHDELLKQYVDVVDDKLVVNDEKSTKIYLS